MEQALQTLQAAHDIPPPSLALAVLYLPASGHTKICFKWYYECKIKEPTLNVLEIVKICFKKTHLWKRLLIT